MKKWLVEMSSYLNECPSLYDSAPPSVIISDMFLQSQGSVILYVLFMALSIIYILVQFLYIFHSFAKININTS